jgi:2-dehydro-3-deoxyphosphogluconate aldolase / (4S)-4-hydroxy-2-oxoglutarate aldolase
MRTRLHRHDMTRRLIAQRVIGIIRTATPADAEDQATVLIEAGLQVIEITLTGEDMIGVLARLRRRHPDVCLGAGTVLDAEAAGACVRDGRADFLVSPALAPAVVRTAHRYGRPAVLGAATPTEILGALEVGADLIKIFPAAALSIGWMRHVISVFPQAALVPTGGIGVDDAADWLRSGAVACGLGSQLGQGTPAEISARVQRLLAQLSVAASPAHRPDSGHGH